jgi:asparagine synthase (glutamine-hydrolysing)
MGDAELILCAYERWEEQCPEKLLGDFAFAVWDARRQTLCCARDHVGVKPFYYYVSSSLFVFGSEIKALFALAAVPRRLNDEMVARYLDAEFEDTTATLYSDIVRLPPGHSLAISTARLDLRRYWSLDPSLELRLPSDDAYANALGEIFADAVRKRLRSAFPIGSELSGGLDSSSVACMARTLRQQSTGEKLHTFSATFETVPESDESRYIQVVAGQQGIAPHFVRGDELDPLGDLERIFWHLDEPFWAPSMFVYAALYKAANREGVRVLLTGEDGDNAVGYGTDYIAALLRTGRWVRAAREASGLAATLNGSVWKVLKQYALRPLLAPIKRADEATLASRIAGKRATLEQWENLTDGTIPYGCEMFDKAAAADAIELRHPFLDKRVIEFCLALPASQKLQHGWVRMILRRALEGVLPETGHWRGGKATLTPNFSHALKAFGGATLKREISDPDGLQRYVSRSAIQHTYDRYMKDDRAVFNSSVWSTVTLGLWLQGFELRN